MKEISIRTNARTMFADITSEVEDYIREAGVQDGICTVYCPHTTAGITINENADPDVQRDIVMKLNRLIPRDEGFAHLEGNSDAHIKSSLIGNSVQVIVERGRLCLGTWQGIYFCEFDGPRTRRFWVKLQ